jgi:hypothetical protein
MPAFLVLACAAAAQPAYDLLLASWIQPAPATPARAC